MGAPAPRGGGDPMIGHALLGIAWAIEEAAMDGHPVWGDGRALDRGWPAMLAWNIGLAAVAGQGVAEPELELGGP